MVVTWTEEYAFEVLNMVHLVFSCFKASLYPKCIPSRRKPQFQPNNDLQSKCVRRSEKCLTVFDHFFVISLKGSIFGIEKKKLRLEGTYWTLHSQLGEPLILVPLYHSSLLFAFRGPLNLPKVLHWLRAKWFQTKKTNPLKRIRCKRMPPT